MANTTNPLDILSIFFLPPQAIARLGGSNTPLESYYWGEDPTITGAARTVIEPDLTLDVRSDGSVFPYRTAHLRFKDGDHLRPIAPFFELWIHRIDGTQSPLTGKILAEFGASPSNISFRVRAANLKAARRCGDPACGYAAQILVAGDDHQRQDLRAVSPRSPGSEPLVFPEAPIPLGTFQVMKPVPGIRSGVDRDVIRVRFTPARGEVYGPPSASSAVAPNVGRTHEIVKAENRILNPAAAWLKYDANRQSYRNPQPADTYDGASSDQQRSWGVVDDTCDMVLTADLVIDGVHRRAHARAMVGPPDYAPDRRPFLSLADELTDRDLPVPPPVVSQKDLEALELRINDLFQRALETASLMGVDAARNRLLAGETAGTDGAPPRTDLNSLTARDRPYSFLANWSDGNALAAASSELAPLPLSDLVPYAHRNLTDLDAMIVRLREDYDRVRILVRPPFARWKELPELPASEDHSRPTPRDPRSPNVELHDMRMPPYMRDSDGNPLSLTHRQYAELMSLLESLRKDVDEAEVKLRGLTQRFSGAAGPLQSVAPRVLYDAPIRRFLQQYALRADEVKLSGKVTMTSAAEAAKPVLKAPDLKAPDQPADKPCDGTTSAKGKIFPVNLTARAAERIPGNPDSTRMESGVGNCFPGLEFDHRNLERRFFPGLVFEFFIAGRGQAQGCRLVAVDLDDPDLNVMQSPVGARPRGDDLQRIVDLRGSLNGINLTPVEGAAWFLGAARQEGRQIQFIDQDGNSRPLDGLTVWRLIRSLEPLPVEIDLVALDASGQPIDTLNTLTLRGWRRRYTQETTGVVSLAFQPGELTQSLCSPWMHDFRDCGCIYWASNHPDIVQLEPRGDRLPSGLGDDPGQGLLRVDWLRSDRSAERSPAAREFRELNRPLQMDHYEINHRWEELAVVLEDQEIGNIYAPREVDTACPYGSMIELAEQLSKLAQLEHVLAVEYLYAYFSVKLPAEVTGADPISRALYEAVLFLGDAVRKLAIAEMQHLRYANQLLWEIVEKEGLPRQEFPPSLIPAKEIPDSAKGQGVPRARQLRPLTLEAVQDFIAVERPSATIEGKYARAVATLRDDPHYDSQYQLASRIAEEGNGHFLLFRQIESVMRLYEKEANATPWLRDLTLATAAQAQPALDLYRQILHELDKGYYPGGNGGVTSRRAVVNARNLMINQAPKDLESVCQKLAMNQKIGVPFFDLFLETA